MDASSRTFAVSQSTRLNLVIHRVGHTSIQLVLNHCVVVYTFLLRRLLPHNFPHLCGVDGSHEPPLFCPVLRSLPWQLSLRSVVPDAIYHFRFGLPLLLFPGTSFTIALLTTLYSSLLNTCPYHFRWHCPTFAVALILSPLVLSRLMTPHIHLNILISTTPNFFSYQSYLFKCSHSFLIPALNIDIWVPI